MRKYFYSSIISTETIEVSLHTLNLDEKEKKHLLALVEENLHLGILDTVMSELSEEDKKIFLTHLHHSSHNRTWEFLISKEINIDKKIQKRVSELIDEMQRDIKDLVMQGN